MRNKGQCSIDGCTNPVRNKGLCNSHYLRQKRYGRTERVRRDAGEGTIKKHGYKAIMTEGDLEYEHRLIAEKAIGKALPDGAVVMHVVKDKLLNKNTNLVICPSNAYRIMIETRQRAYEAAGDPDARPCGRCGKYDLPENMYEYRSNSLEGYRYRHKAERGECIKTYIGLQLKGGKTVTKLLNEEKDNG